MLTTRDWFCMASEPWKMKPAAHLVAACACTQSSPIQSTREQLCSTMSLAPHTHPKTISSIHKLFMMPTQCGMHSSGSVHQRGLHVVEGQPAHIITSALAQLSFHKLPSWQQAPLNIQALLIWQSGGHCKLITPALLSWAGLPCRLGGNVQQPPLTTHPQKRL